MLGNHCGNSDMRLPPMGREGRRRRHWSKKGGLGVGRFMVEVDGGRF